MCTCSSSSLLCNYPKSDRQLYSIIGEDKTLSIKLGAEAGDANTEDIIVVRGISADVNRAVKEIEQIVEAAKNDEIVNSYVRGWCFCTLFAVD